MKTKICTKCGEEKPATSEFFYRNCNRLHSECKLCFNIRCCKWDFENKNKRKSISANWRRRHPEKAKEVFSIYNKKSCDSLDDRYVICKIMQMSGLSYRKVKNNPELIEQKRAIIQLKRTIKILNHAT